MELACNFRFFFSQNVILRVFHHNVRERPDSHTVTHHRDSMLHRSADFPNNRSACIPIAGIGRHRVTFHATQTWVSSGDKRRHRPHPGGRRGNQLFNR